MTETLPDPMTLPVRRGCPFDPPEEYGRLRAERPISRLRLPGGRIGWLVTRYQDARATLADPKFTPPLMQIAPVEEFAFNEAEIAELEIPPGTFSALDPPEQTRYRRLVAQHFTVKHMRELTPRIEQIVAELLDDIERGGPPADLVSGFALPIPGRVISELLGVPVGQRDEFQHQTSAMLSWVSDGTEIREAREAIYKSLGELVAAKRRAPGQDVLSGLVHSDNSLTDEEVVNMGVLLLIAGLETTANMLGLGAFALLEHPEQLDALRAGPELLDQAVEELLRYLTIVQFGLTRTAREATVVAGQPIAAGETVIVSLAAGNRDAEVFAEPDRLDITRRREQHLAFGYGVHQCLGAQLARVEMRIGFRALFQRFPTLRLAVPAAEVSLGEDMVFYGAHSLPVTWDS